MTYEEAKYKTIQTEQEGDVFILTLHRPEKRNALNQQLRIEVVDALMSVRANPEVRAIIIWGGQHVFSAGADLSEMVNPVLCSSSARSIRFNPVVICGKQWLQCYSRPLQQFREVPSEGAASFHLHVIFVLPLKRRCSGKLRLMWASSLVPGGHSDYRVWLA